jgi:NADH-quinone oxidoreductase subunit I/NAD(P)H-quinone oxidoreductase subunit I
LFLALQNYFLNIKKSFMSIFEGMAVTLSYLARKPITIQYPDRIPKSVPEMLPPSYRGVLEVDLKICTGCLACMKRCPIDVIKIETFRDVDAKKNYMTRFDIDIAKCMFCGLCTEVCPTGSIRHSTEFEASSANIINMVMNYIRYGDKIPVYKPVKDQEPQSIPQNEAFRQVHVSWDTPPPLNSDVVRGSVRWKSDKPTEEKS